MSAGPRMVCDQCRGGTSEFAAFCGHCFGVGSLPVQLMPESAQRVAREVVAARLAELADKEGGLMFDDFKGDGYETMGMWVGAKALLNLLFPETP